MSNSKKAKPIGYDASTLKTLLKETFDEEITPSLISRVERHEKVLYGNGKPGMVAEVTLLSERLKTFTTHISAEMRTVVEHVKALTEWKQNLNIKTAIIGGVASFVSLALGSLLTFIVTQYEKLAKLIDIVVENGP